MAGGYTPTMYSEKTISASLYAMCAVAVPEDFEDLTMPARSLSDDAVHKGSDLNNRVRCPQYCNYYYYYYHQHHGTICVCGVICLGADIYMSRFYLRHR